MNQTSKLVEALENIVKLDSVDNRITVIAQQALESYKDGEYELVSIGEEVIKLPIQQQTEYRDEWVSVEEVAQWVIDNRYPKSELDKLSDHELYHGLIDRIKSLPTPPQTKTI